MMLKAETPDAILIGGDIIDGSYRPVAEERMAEEFRNLGIPVIACLGNHDYYTGISADLQFCREAGIMVLRDKAVFLDGIGNITVVGRDDRTNLHRKPLAEILQGVDKSRFLLELDHQPYHLEEAEKNGIDFEFAGHTHQALPCLDEVSIGHALISDALYLGIEETIRQYLLCFSLGFFNAIAVNFLQ